MGKSKKQKAEDLLEQVDGIQSSVEADGAAGGEINSDETPNPEDAPETEKLSEDINGQGYIPGTEPSVPVEIKPLIESVKNIELYLKPSFASARNALVAEQENLADLCHKNIAHFSEPDEKGTRTYKFGKTSVSIIFEKEKIKTKLEDDEDDD